MRVGKAMKRLTNQIMKTVNFVVLKERRGELGLTILRYLKVKVQLL